MKARDLMTPDPAVATLDQSLSDAARIMRDQDIGMVPVVDNPSNRNLRGVITDRDIAIRHVAERHTEDCPITAHMTRDSLDTVSPEAEASEVMEVMKRGQVRRVLVTEGDRLVGVIAQADLALEEEGIRPAEVEEVVERVSAPSVKLTDER